MPLSPKLRSLWSNLVRRDRVERALDEELESYVDMLADEHVRAGMSRDAARRQALIDAGGVTQVKEATREAWVGDGLAGVARDVRYAARTLRRSPGFFAMATLILAIGIGGATAVFTVIKGSLLRPLPAVPEPDRLVTVERVQNGTVIGDFSYADYRDFRTRTTALSGLAGFDGMSAPFTTVTSTEREWVSFVTDDFFTVLGVRQAAGRFFTAADSLGAGPDAARVIVISHALWQRRFGGAASAIGAPMTLDGHAFTVIGVAPPRFIGGMATHTMDAWIPITVGTHRSPVFATHNFDSRRGGMVRLVGRLAPGRTVDDAAADLSATASWLAATYPSNRGRTVRVWPGAGMTTEEREMASRVPRLLTVAVALLLLIACGNVASLSLIRMSARRREMATRVALGASRSRLVRQVVMEGAAIAATAAALGIVFAVLLVCSAALVQTVIVMDDIDLTLDLRVLGVAVVSSTLTAALISVPPAAHAVRLPPGAVLRDGAGAGRRRSPVQRALVSLQVGASLVLLVAAATLYATFNRVMAGHASVEPGAILASSLQAPRSANDPAKQVAFFDAVLRNAGSEVKIARAAVTSTVPPFDWASRATVFRRGEEPTRAALVGRELELGLRVSIVNVSATFFDVMRIPFLSGRNFGASDVRGAEPVVIINRRLASALWPTRDATGQVIAWPSVEGPERPPLRVIGVVGDTRDVGLSDSPSPAMYVPFAQQPRQSLMLITRARSGADVSFEDVKRVVAATDPAATVVGGRTLLDRLADEVRPQQRASAWIAVFGVIALVIASMGLYGIVAQYVQQRTRELAVRSALGASPRTILATVLGDAVRPAFYGAVLGVAASLAAIPVLQSLFTGVRPVDSRLSVIALGALAAALLGAAWLPAHRAARLSPAAALRSD